MVIIKDICFWIIFSIGFIVSLAGLGMLLDWMLKRYMVYRNIFTGFIEFMRHDMKERKSRQ